MLIKQFASINVTAHRLQTVRTKSKRPEEFYSESSGLALVDMSYSKKKRNMPMNIAGLWAKTTTTARKAM